MKYQKFTFKKKHYNWKLTTESILAALFVVVGSQFVSNQFVSADSKEPVTTPTDNQTDQKTLTINFTYNNQTLSTKTYQVKSNTDVNYGNDIPEGYTLGTTSTVFHMGNESTDLTVNVSKIQEQPTLTVTFMDGSKNLGQKTYQVAPNTDVNYGSDIPAGYTMNGASTVAHVGNGNMDLTANVTKNNPTLTVTFMDGNKNLGQKTYQVTPNTDVNYGNDIPAGYTMGTTSTVVHVGNGNINFTANVTKNNPTLTVTFMDGSENLGQKTYQVTPNTDVNYGNDIPAGYTMGTTSTVVHVGNGNINFTANVTKNNPTLTVTFMDGSDNLGQKTYQVTPNTDVNYGNDIPEGYTMNGASTVAHVGTGDTNLTVHLEKLNQKLTILFKHNGTLLTSKTYTVQPHQNFDYGNDIPAGYTMGGKVTLINTGGSDLTCTVNLDKVPSTQHQLTLLFKYNGSLLKSKTYSVQPHQNFDYSNDIPAGYTMNGKVTLVNTGSDDLTYTVNVAKDTSSESNSETNSNDNSNKSSQTSNSTSEEKTNSSSTTSSNTTSSSSSSVTSSSTTSSNSSSTASSSITSSSSSSEHSTSTNNGESTNSSNPSSTSTTNSGSATSSSTSTTSSSSATSSLTSTTNSASSTSSSTSTTSSSSSTSSSTSTTSSSSSTSSSTSTTSSSSSTSSSTNTTNSSSSTSESSTTSNSSSSNSNASNKSTVDATNKGKSSSQKNSVGNSTDNHSLSTSDNFKDSSKLPQTGEVDTKQKASILGLISIALASLVAPLYKRKKK